MDELCGGLFGENDGNMLMMMELIEELMMMHQNQECSCHQISMSKWFAITILDSNAASTPSSKYKHNVSTRK